MKIVKYLFVLALLAASAGNVHTAAAAPSANESAAEAVLTRYFDALSQGDVLTLQSLMAGNLLKKRAPLLSNPTYPAFLIRTFGSARFQIDAVSTIAPSDIAIDATIIFDQDNASHRRYLLHEEASSASDSNPSFYVIDDLTPGIRY
jgi:hypothetical protein